MNKPLRDKGIVVTRDARQAAAFVEALKQQGARPVLFPTIRIEAVEGTPEIKNALARIRTFDWLIFSSTNAARYFLEQTESETLAEFRGQIAAVGSKTGRYLKEQGLNIDLVPDNFTAKDLLRRLEDFDLRGKRILIPQSDRARAELNSGLHKLGAIPEHITVYRTMPCSRSDGKDMNRLISANAIDCLTFFSPSAFKFFIEICGQEVIGKIVNNQISLAAIGPTTSAAIRKQGLAVGIEPENSSHEQLIQALIQYYNSH